MPSAAKLNRHSNPVARRSNAGILSPSRPIANHEARSLRPIPQSRHTLAALIFIAVSALAAWAALADPKISPVQVNIGCAALKESQQEPFTGDQVFGKSDLWQFYTPVLLGVLKLVLVPTHYADVVLPFRLMVGPTVLLFLGGMYALLYRQTRSWSVSAFVAVLSATVVYVLGGANFGLGTLATMTPQDVLLAMTPLIVLAYLNYEEHWRLVLVFLFIGLMGNVHLVTAMNLTLVLLIVYLGRHGFRPRAWATAAVCGLCSLLAAAPYMGYYLGLRLNIPDPHATVSAKVVGMAFDLSNQQVLFPDLLKGLWDVNLWRLALLGVVAVTVLCRWERFRLRDGSAWLWMIVAVLLVSLGFQGASQALGASWGGGPPVIDFLKASSLLLLPLYVLLAQGLVNLFRLVRVHRRLLQWCCIGLLLAWVVPSENLEQARQRAYLCWTALRGMRRSGSMSLRRSRSRRDPAERARRVPGNRGGRTRCRCS